MLRSIIQCRPAQFNHNAYSAHSATLEGLLVEVDQKQYLFSHAHNPALDKESIQIESLIADLYDLNQKEFVNIKLLPALPVLTHLKVQASSDRDWRLFGENSEFVSNNFCFQISAIALGQKLFVFLARWPGNSL
jgi:hypothetical protein